MTKKYLHVNAISVFISFILIGPCPFTIAQTQFDQRYTKNKQKQTNNTIQLQQLDRHSVMHLTIYTFTFILIIFF